MNSMPHEPNENNRTLIADHEKAMLRLRGNAVLLAFLLACWLGIHFATRSLDVYRGIGMESFLGFLFFGVPGLLLLLYVLLARLIAAGKNDLTNGRVGNLVAVILMIPVGVMLFVLVGFYLDFQNATEGPLDFALPGIYVFFFARIFLASLVFYLFNTRLISFSLRWTDRPGVGVFLLRPVVTLLLLGLAFGACYLHSDWKEYRHRQCANNGEYKILTVIEPHELLLLDRSNRLFVLNPESVTLTPITTNQVAEKFPEIGRELREKDYNSIPALASSWLKQYPGYPNIDRTASSPDGRWKIETTNQGTSLLTENAGKFKSVRLYHGLWVACQTFTPDGKYVLVQGNRANVVLSDVPIKLDRIVLWRVPDWSPSNQITQLKSSKVNPL